jgi:hypothetical protein
MTRRSSLLGAGEHVLERSVSKTAALQPVGTVDGDDTMQVVLSIKRGTGIPVPDDRYTTLTIYYSITEIHSSLAFEVRCCTSCLLHFSVSSVSVTLRHGHLNCQE